jgi:hypothetical protein
MGGLSGQAQGWCGNSAIQGQFGGLNNGKVTARETPRLHQGATVRLREGLALERLNSETQRYTMKHD